MTRLVPVTLLVVLAVSRVANADDTEPPVGPLASGATITFSELQIHENNNPVLDFPERDPESRWRYFNLAHCQCSQPGANPGSDFRETTFAYLLKLENANGQLVNRPLEVWVGTNCMADTAQTGPTATCHRIDSAGLNSVDLLTTPGDFRPEIPIFDFMTPTPGATTCLEAAQTSTLWAFVDTNMNSKADYFASTQLTTDSLAPNLPTNLRASGVSGGIQLSWDPPDDAADTYRYQALCARADDDSPGKTSGRPDRYYDTAPVLCGANIPFLLTVIDVPPALGVDSEGPAVAVPPGLADLDPSFLCDEDQNAASSGFKIEGLEDGVPYKVVLLAMDKFGNARGVSISRTITPVPSTDFWEDLHDRGSQAEGGFCTVTRTPGSGPWSVLAVIATAWWLVRRNVARQSRRTTGSARWAGLALGVVLVAPGASHAQGGFQPYWENTDPDSEPELAPDDPALVKWHAGIRVGPYVPEIDAQLGGPSPGPYEQMFGGSQILTMLDVDRILWTGFGQLGIGVSVGYMQKTARTFTIESESSDPMRARASDRNTFRLLPTALTATYRFTALDDAYGIPVVPYVRGGLAYHLWWLSADGTTVCQDGGMLPDCAQNPARGGSLGFQGSIGLAIRAERVDPSTAMSMRQSGIQHAGIYGELSLAKVDGFGSATKLSVGDRTWFAGVNFEF